MKVSIITVCYNSSKCIEKTIKSVVQQTYPDIEYIIIDGGSTDGTIDIINRYKEKIDLVISEKDSGIYDAFNKGIRNSTGELITFLNAGDYYLNDYCNTAISNFAPNCSFICSNVFYFNSKNFSEIVKPSFPEIKLGKPPFLHPAFIVRRSLFDDIGFFSLKFRTFSDFDWMLRLVRRNVTGQYFNFTKVYFELDGASNRLLVTEYIKVLIENRYNSIQILYCALGYVFSHFKIWLKYFSR